MIEIHWFMREPINYQNAIHTIIFHINNRIQLFEYIIILIINFNNGYWYFDTIFIYARNTFLNSIVLG